MCSPVLHTMLCGGFRESIGRKIKLKDVNGATFCKAIDMWCGKESSTELELEEVKELAGVADRFQMAEVSSAIDESVMKHLDISICGAVLSWGGELGLLQSEAAARKLATERFDELVTTEGFMWMSEEALGGLLEDDDLAARNEEAVWEAVTQWRTVEVGHG